jgi:hypothetical protein
LKRVSVEHCSSLKLHLPHSNGAGKPISEVSLYIMSDSYVGLDLQYKIDLRQKRLFLVDPTSNSVDPSGNVHRKSKVESVVLGAGNVVSVMAEEDEPSCG